MVELNTIHNMDCIEGLKLVEDNSIDLIVTSPPYNIGIDYDSWKDSMPWGEYLDWCKKWLQECYRVLKPDGRMCLNHYIAFASPFEECCQFPLMDFRNIQMEIGFNVHKIAIWTDRSMKKFTAWGSWLSASSPNIQTPYEGILISYKNQWGKINKGESTIDKEMFLEGVSGLWDLGTTRSVTKACFPESLPEMCINLLSYKGDTILDPFSGSGTTCCVAKRLHRNFVGFEISQKYHKISMDRLLQNSYESEDLF